MPDLKPFLRLSHHCCISVLLGTLFLLSCGLGLRAPHERQPRDHCAAQVVEVQVLVTEPGALERLVPRCPETVAGPRLAKGVSQDCPFGFPGRRESSAALSGAPTGIPTRFLPLPCFTRIFLPSYCIQVSRIKSPCRCPVHRASNNANCNSSEATAQNFLMWSAVQMISV